MNEKIDIIDLTCKQVDSVLKHIEETNPDMLWMFTIQKSYWDMVRDAKKNGKKLVFFGGPIPIELFWAFDCVPFFLDTLPTRVASQEELAARFIDETHKYAPSSMCAIDKVQLGAVLRGDLGIKPDAFIHATIACDSARIAYPIMDSIFDCPCFTLDLPFRHDERGYRYIASQLDDVVKFFEEITGKKLDLDKLREVMEESNKAYDYLKKCTDQRKNKPCPLPGRMLVLNGLVANMSGHPAITEMMKTEYETGQMLTELGMTATRAPEEKYRVCLLQNMLWSNMGTLDWMEKVYGAVTVMDAFGYQDGILYDTSADWEQIKYVMAQKLLYVPMIHGASGPTEHYIKIVDQIMDEYSVNVSIFMGHVGCKHTWASAKIVTDMIQNKYGLPTLYVDVDAVDPRYKSKDELRSQISQYMESVVGAKKLTL